MAILTADRRENGRPKEIKEKPICAAAHLFTVARVALVSLAMVAVQTPAPRPADH